ncbi:MAG: amidohydrolase, partial [Candidatus Rokubacteria bacterium]|nr:amidohydrolase [Candidatus Rokubacteria bacterium]
MNRSVLRLIGAVGLATLGLLGAETAGAQSAETILLNGKVVTLDTRSSVHEAVAIRDGKIAAVGRSAEVRGLAGPTTRVIDLQGRTVIPGLIDS